jgi:hypothetical protein
LHSTKSGDAPSAASPRLPRRRRGVLPMCWRRSSARRCRRPRRGGHPEVAHGEQDGRPPARASSSARCLCLEQRWRPFGGATTADRRSTRGTEPRARPLRPPLPSPQRQPPRDRKSDCLGGRSSCHRLDLAVYGRRRPLPP